jgi:hypothetical protein
MAEIEERLNRVALSQATLVGLRKGFAAWQERGRRHALTKRAAASLLHRNLRKGMNAWSCTVAERARQLAALRAAAASCYHRGLRTATNAWVAMARERKAAASRLADAGSRWANHALMAVWSKLAQAAAQRRKLMGTAACVASSLLHRNLRKGMNAWIDLVVKAARRLGALRAAAASCYHRGLRRALNAWVGVASVRRTAVAQLQLSVRSWIHRACSSSWRKLASQSLQRRKAAKVAKSFVLRRERRSISGWRMVVLEKSRHQAALHASGAAFTHRGLCRALNAWERLVAGRTPMAHLYESAARLLLARDHARVWCKLVALHSTAQKLRRGPRLLVCHRQRRGFIAWRTMCGDRHSGDGNAGGRSLSLTSSSMMRRAEAHQLRTLWGAWQAAAGVQRSISQRDLASALSCTRRDLQRGFRGLADARTARRVVLQSGRNAFRHARRRALHTWCDRSVLHTLGQRQLERQNKFASAHAAGVHLRLRWKVWTLYTMSCHVPPPPPPPLRHRVIRWARARAPRPLAVPFKVAADEKLRCARLLLIPFAALVVRSDGTLFRVADVRRPPGSDSTSLCVVDLANGIDEWMLAQHPLPPEAQLERQARAAPFETVCADRIDHPAYPIVIPCFFGGVLPLLNGLGVRVIDVDYGNPDAVHAARAVTTDAGIAGSLALASGLAPGLAPGTATGEAHGLAHIKITLIDDAGEPVGKAVWCDVHELLASLADRVVLVPTCDSEQALRRKERFELHRREQQRVALGALARARDNPWAERMDAAAAAGGRGEGRGGRKADEEACMVLGIGGLQSQIDQAAPSTTPAAPRLGGGGPAAKWGKVRHAAGREARRSKRGTFKPMSATTLTHLERSAQVANVGWGAPARETE